jgi:hypothetical protein
MDGVIVDNHFSNALELLQPLGYVGKKITNENLIAIASCELPLFLNGFISF